MITSTRDIYDYRHMYQQFIVDANEDYHSKLDEIRHYRSLLNKIKFEIESKRDIIQDIFGICIYNYWEWNTDEYDYNLKMLNAVTEGFNNIKNITSESSYLYQKLQRYFRVSYKYNTTKKQLVRIKNRKNVTKDQFRDILSRYYKQVGVEVLEGRLYKFSRCIGFLLVERLRMDSRDIPMDNNRIYKFENRGYIDWKASMENKKNLIAEGKRPYSYKEEQKFIAQGKKYDGVYWLVWKYTKYYCRPMIIDRRFRNSTYTRFEPKMKERQMSNEDILSKYNPKCPKDIIEMRDETISKRLILLLTNYETYTQKYIRNELQIPITSRSYNRSTGQ